MPKIETTLAEKVVDHLLTGLFSGGRAKQDSRDPQARAKYAPGSRLPPERDLVEQLGASRVTVRQAMQRLAGWGILSIRWGSGAVIQPLRYWSIEVLPAYLRALLKRRDSDALANVMRDAVDLRRSLVMDRLCESAGCFEPGALDPARAAMHKAWDKRDDFKAFVQHDLEMERLILEAAGMYASLWTLNSLTDVYLQVVELLGIDTTVPKEYVASHEALFDALETGNSAKARKVVAPYLASLEKLTIGRLANSSTR